uniref:Uncharacterized protein n=1 Tax=Psilocybe cubensis TaxID=181762 RepID=A0A8H7Y199_PSICU
MKPLKSTIVDGVFNLLNKLPKRWHLKELLFVSTSLLTMIGFSALLTLAPISTQTTAAATFRSDVLNGKQDGIFFLGHIYQIDIPGRTFEVQWIVGACGRFLLTSAETYDANRAQCGAPNVPLNIYIDNNLVNTYNPDDLYDFNESTNKTIGVVHFLKTHSIDIATAQLGSKRVYDQLFWYPFDFYHSGSDFFVINANDNSSLPVIKAVFADPVNNFAPQSTETRTKALVNGTLIESRNTVVNLSRTLNAKMYTILLFIVNWGLTLLVAHITTLVICGQKLGEGIVVLPLTMILTMPTIRGLFVENPPFDSVGIVLQMIVVSLCSVLILIPIVSKEPAPTYISLPTKEHD